MSSGRLSFDADVDIPPVDIYSSSVERRSAGESTAETVDPEIMELCDRVIKNKNGVKVLPADLPKLKYCLSLREEELRSAPSNIKDYDALQRIHDVLEEIDEKTQSLLSSEFSLPEVQQLEKRLLNCELRLLKGRKEMEQVAKVFEERRKVDLLKLKENQRLEREKGESGFASVPYRYSSKLRTLQEEQEHREKFGQLMEAKKLQRTVNKLKSAEEMEWRKDLSSRKARYLEQLREKHKRELNGFEDKRKREWTVLVGNSEKEQKHLEFVIKTCRERIAELKSISRLDSSPRVRKSRLSLGVHYGLFMTPRGAVSGSVSAAVFAQFNETNGSRSLRSAKSGDPLKRRRATTALG
jgi:hypothetical protein